MKNLSSFRSALQRHPIPAPLEFLQFILRRVREDRCMEAAGSLTFTTLLALVPFFTIALMVASAFPMFDEVSTRFKTFLLTNLVPESAGRIITVYMRQFTDNADRLTLVGMLSLAGTALAMMFTIDKAFNRIWRVRRSRPMVVKTLIYWAVLTLGPLLLGISLTLTSWLASKSGAGGSGVALLLSGSSFLLSVCGFALLYRVVPNCPVPARHALASALFTALAFELMKKLFGWYVQQFGTFKLIYGAFASVPIFLIWLYIAWVIVLCGAVLSATLSYWRGQAWRRRPHPERRLNDALRLLLLLDIAHQRGETHSLGRLRRTLGAGQDEMHELLERLADRGWVQATRNGRWVLSTALSAIRAKDVYHLLVDRQAAPAHSHDSVQTLIEGAFARLDSELDLSLAEIAARSRSGQDEPPPALLQPPVAEPAAPAQIK
ncbi:YihY family inner membrane protein [Chitinimonas lacunae]|uniref:UPF0761 membrane protein ACFOW7_12490 n=1 Tax=Chitinimonas lacunae TaxID=1963018 RepID=A0ABV8MPP8_9NEIS